MNRYFKNKIKNKDPGFSVISLCVICLMLVALMVTFSFKMKMFYNTKTFVDDAITNANLSAATIDGYDYGETGNITNFNYDEMYMEYLETLEHDLGADVIDGPLGVTLAPKHNVHFNSNVNVLKFYVYNKTADGKITFAKVVDSPDENKGTVGVYYGNSLEKPITEDKAITPDGTYMEDDYSCMMIYSQISFDVNGIFGNSKFYGSTNSPMYRVKEHSVDVVTTHGYQEIDRLEPTCLDDGYIVYKCTNDACPNGVGHEYTLILPALGHNFLETYTYEDNNGVTNGHRYRKCSRCTETINHQYKVDIKKTNYIDTISDSGYYNVGDTISILAVTKAGSIWDGWSGTYSFANKEAEFTMPEQAVSLTANSHTTYKVQHWQQTVTGGTAENSTNFKLVSGDTTTHNSTALSVSPAVKTYTGFTSPSKKTVTLASDGSTVINYYYTRKEYTVTLTKGTGIASVTGADTYRYGASVTITAEVSTTHDYSWVNWTGTATVTDRAYTFTMPANNVSYKANGIETVTFAIYSATDTSLRFYRSTSVPSSGSTYKDRKVTAIYTRVNELALTDVASQPWKAYQTKITKVVVENTIYPTNTAHWFEDLEYCTSLTVTNINMSKCTNATNMFNHAGAEKGNTTISNLANWNVSKVTSMSGMFGSVGYDYTVTMSNLSSWNVSSVKSMSYMFGDHGRGGVISFAFANWNTHNVTNFQRMFRATGKMSKKSWTVGNIAKWNTHNATNMEGMFSEAGKYSSYSLNLKPWNVKKVTNYSSFESGVESKIITPWN